MQSGSRACSKAIRLNHLHHHHGVIGQGRTNGHGLARLEFGQTGRYRGLGRPVGVEHLAGRIGPARHQCFRAHLAAQIDEAQTGHILREQRQQRGHGMQHRDLLRNQRLGQSLRVASNLARGQP